MSPEAQRMAIAAECGMKLVMAEDGWWDFENKSLGLNMADAMRQIPDYLTDLNAMHEAEAMLGKAARDRIADWLDDGNGGHFASAAMRAEAFLRTIGKWRDGN